MADAAVTDGRAGMRGIIVVSFGLAWLATNASAQTANPSPAVAPIPNAEKPIRRPVKNTKSPRYRDGTPVLAQGINGVRINAVGEVLFDNP